MRRIRRRPGRVFAALAALAATALAGCIRDSDPIAIDLDTVTVHAILEAGSDSVLISLARGDFRPIEGATVRIIHGPDTTVAVEGASVCLAPQWPTFGQTPDPRGCYRALLPEPVIPEDDYRLEIGLADGGIVTGVTRVAAMPEVRAPAPLERIAVRCPDVDSCYGTPLPRPPYIEPVARVPISWDRPAEAGRIDLRLVTRNVYLDGTDRGSGCQLGYSQQTTVSLAADSVLWGITAIGCVLALDPARFDSIRAEVVVTALNASYARYLEAVDRGGNVRGEAAAQGISGGYGVFGAVSAARREVMLVRVGAGG